jgi:hypothetical protein
VVAVTGDHWPGAEDLRAQMMAQLAVEARFPGWQVVHATSERWVRYTKVPEGHFYAVHDRLSEPPLIAIDLDQLAVLMQRRQREIEDAKRWAARSDLRGILPFIRRRR